MFAPRRRARGAFDRFAKVVAIPNIVRIKPPGLTVPSVMFGANPPGQEFREYARPEMQRLLARKITSVVCIRSTTRTAMAHGWRSGDSPAA
jgi:hypothetical protein